MIHDLTDLFWTEAKCPRTAKGGGYRCHEILQTREDKLCSSCSAFVKLREAERLLLTEDGEEADRRVTGQTPH